MFQCSTNFGAEADYVSMHIVSDEDTYPEILGMLIHALETLLDPLGVFFILQYLLPILDNICFSMTVSSESFLKVIQNVD